MSKNVCKNGQMKMFKIHNPYVEWCFLYTLTQLFIRNFTEHNKGEQNVVDHSLEAGVFQDSWHYLP